jgi:hypothetical protein
MERPLRTRAPCEGYPQRARVPQAAPVLATRIDSKIFASRGDEIAYAPLSATNDLR